MPFWNCPFLKMPFWICPFLLMPFIKMPFWKCPLLKMPFRKCPFKNALYQDVLFVGPLPSLTMECIGNHPASKPGHLAQRLKPALLIGTCPQTQTFSESICQWLFKNWQRNTNTKNDKDYYKDEDNDNDKDKDAKAITGTLTVCYIFGILPDDSLSTAQHCPVQSSAAQYILVPPSIVQYRPIQSSTAQYSPVPPTTVQYRPYSLVPLNTV